MARTTVNTLVAEIKREVDYDITDTDLDTLVLQAINKGLKRLKQLFLDRAISQGVTANASFKTIDSQAYRDITKAVIVGDATTFDGTAFTTPKINVTIDGTAYADIDISTCTTIALVVAAINTAVTAGSPASVNGGGYLVISSLTTGATSVVTIADGTTTGETVVAELFSVVAERTQSAIVDLDEIIQLSERTNDSIIPIIPYDKFIELYPDPTANEQTSPEVAALHADRIYFGATPTSSILIYLDYVKIIAKSAAGGTLPFEDKYDPLLVAMSIETLVKWLDRNNAVALASAKADVKELIDEVIMGAHNISTIRQSASRRARPIIFPRSPD